MSNSLVKEQGWRVLGSCIPDCSSSRSMNLYHFSFPLLERIQKTRLFYIFTTLHYCADVCMMIIFVFGYRGSTRIPSYTKVLLGIQTVSHAPPVTRPCLVRSLHHVTRSHTVINALENCLARSAISVTG